MNTAQRWTVSLVAVLSPLAAFGLLLWGVSADSDGPIWGFFLAAFGWTSSRRALVPACN